MTEAFKRDTSPDKLNLGVGAYRTEELKPLVLNVGGVGEGGWVSVGCGAGAQCVGGVGREGTSAAARS